MEIEGLSVITDSTQYDALAEVLAHLAALLGSAQTMTPQAYGFAVQAQEALALAIEKYEAQTE